VACTPASVMENRPHVLAVSNGGATYSWGCGLENQLGHGSSIEKEPYPRIIRTLEGTPIANVACGNGLSVARSRGEALYVWGQKHPFPHLMRSDVTSVAAAGKYALFSTKQGEVREYSFIKSLDLFSFL
jgi:hypothetical protein